MAVTVNQCGVLEFGEGWWETRYCLVEKLLSPPKHFMKFNLNSGDARENDYPDPMPAGMNMSRWRSDFDVAQAFSHFTIEMSSMDEALLDIQGVGRTYTDLAVASRKYEKGLGGTTDLGEDAIVNFLNIH